MATFSKIPSIAGGPARRIYDVIVLGGQLAGALAAALLAKRGYRTLMVEHDGMGSGYEHGGFLLPYAPFIAPPLRSLPSAEEAMTELALTTTVVRTVRPHTPDLQLILPRHRLDLHRDEPKRAAELTREFGEASEAIHTTFKALLTHHEQTDPFFRQPPPMPAEGFFETMALKSHLKRFPSISQPVPEDGSAAMQLVFALAPFLNYLDAPTEAMARGRALSLALSAPGRYPGGREGLRELLLKRFTDLGGQVLSKENSEEGIAEELSFEGGKLVGVKVHNSENPYRAHTLVAATDSPALRRLIPDKKKHHKLADQLELSTTKRLLFTVNWVLSADALPRGMGELLLIQGEGDTPPVLIQVSPARRVGKGEDEALRVVCAGAFVPASTRELGENHLRAVGDRIEAQLADLMPFARAQLQLSSCPYLDASGVRGSRLLPHPLFQMAVEQLVGVEGISQHTPLKNLFIANREVLPGLGLEGEFLAGLRAAGLVQDGMKKRDPLKR